MTKTTIVTLPDGELATAIVTLPDGELATAIVTLPDGELATAWTRDVGRDVETKVVQEYKLFGRGPWIYRGTQLTPATPAQAESYLAAVSARAA